MLHFDFTLEKLTIEKQESKMNIHWNKYSKEIHLVAIVAHDVGVSQNKNNCGGEDENETNQSIFRLVDWGKDKLREDFDNLRKEYLSE